MEALARKVGLSIRTVEVPVPPNSDSLGSWIESAASWLGIEAEPTEVSYAEVGRLVRGVAPAILRISVDGEARFIALVRSGRHVSVVTPDHRAVMLEGETVRSALCREWEAPLEGELAKVLAHVPLDRHEIVRAAILRERLGSVRIGGCWLLRMPAGSSFARQVRQAGLVRNLGTLLVAHTAQYFLWILAWTMVGRGALEGHLDLGWLLAWLLLLATLVPFRMWATWSQGLFAIGVGRLLKERLLVGALKLDPEETRHQGAGQLLGRVIEAEAVESLALSGGFLALLALIELCLAGTVLALLGAGFVTLLIVWISLTAFLSWRYFLARSAWTSARLEMTQDLVEGMVGHRTRLAQESPSRRHDGEDQSLEKYLGLSRSMDTKVGWLSALLPRGWILVGLLALAPAFVSGRASVTALAVGLGGILLAYRALGKMTAGLSQLAGAAIAWRQVALLYRAAERLETIGSPVVSLGASGSGTLLEAHDVVFRYADRAEPVLRSCSLRISTGDRILLEGQSGCGKSTLAAVLIGLRSPESGLLLLRGLDRHTLGSNGWRRLVVAAPQFHENHVLTETFAFNLLMGRRWPPEPGDMEDAEEVCRDLGLGELIGRMPSGLLQMVGESGWQLSHGERSRLFIARALLQKAEVVILDESFAALDPENLRRALECVQRRAKTMLVIAHP